MQDINVWPACVFFCCCTLGNAPAVPGCLRWPSPQAGSNWAAYQRAALPCYQRQLCSDLALQYLKWSLYKKSRAITHAWRLHVQPWYIRRARAERPGLNLITPIKTGEKGEKNEAANWWKLPLVTSLRTQRWFLSDRNLKNDFPGWLDNSSLSLPVRPPRPPKTTP